MSLQGKEEAESDAPDVAPNGAMASTQTHGINALDCDPVPICIFTDIKNVVCQLHFPWDTTIKELVGIAAGYAEPEYLRKAMVLRAGFSRAYGPDSRDEVGALFPDAALSSCKSVRGMWQGEWCVMTLVPATLTERETGFGTFLDDAILGDSGYRDGSSTALPPVGAKTSESASSANDIWWPGVVDGTDELFPSPPHGSSAPPAEPSAMNIDHGSARIRVYTSEATYAEENPNPIYYCDLELPWDFSVDTVSGLACAELGLEGTFMDIRNADRRYGIDVLDPTATLMSYKSDLPWDGPYGGVFILVNKGKDENRRAVKRRTAGEDAGTNIDLLDERALLEYADSMYTMGLQWKYAEAMDMLRVKRATGAFEGESVDALRGAYTPQQHDKEVAALAMWRRRKAEKDAALQTPAFKADTTKLDHVIDIDGPPPSYQEGGDYGPANEYWKAKIMSLAETTWPQAPAESHSEIWRRRKAEKTRRSADVAAYREAWANPPADAVTTTATDASPAHRPGKSFEMQESLAIQPPGRGPASAMAFPISVCNPGHTHYVIIWALPADSVDFIASFAAAALRVHGGPRSCYVLIETRRDGSRVTYCRELLRDCWPAIRDRGTRVEVQTAPMEKFYKVD